MDQVTSSGILVALGLSTFAGLSTGIGSLMAFFAKEADHRLLTMVLGFSAGVMIYVSFGELYPAGIDALEQAHGARQGAWLATAAFFAGMLLIAAIDKLIPAPHEFADVAEGEPGVPHAHVHVHSGALHVLHDRPEHAPSKPGGPPAARGGRSSARLFRAGLLTALALGLHNFPEGIATFIGALKDPRLGLAIAVAVAIHNIPEGVAVSMPVFYATGDRKKAFWYSLSSGIAEPVGALLAFAVLLPFLNDTIFGLLFAAIAGIMVFISLDQLLPAAEEYGEHHLSIYGLLAGMAVMALSLLLLK